MFVDHSCMHGIPMAMRTHVGVWSLAECVPTGVLIVQVENGGGELMGRVDGSPSAGTLGRECVGPVLVHQLLAAGGMICT